MTTDKIAMKNVCNTPPMKHKPKCFSFPSEAYIRNGKFYLNNKCLGDIIKETTEEIHIKSTSFIREIIVIQKIPPVRS